MLRYKNKVTGRTVEVAEPKEREVELAKATRRGRPFSRDKVKVEVKRRKRTIEKLDDSWKWERVDGRGNGGGRARRGRGKAETETPDGGQDEGQKDT